MAPLMTRLGQDDEFASYVAAVRAPNARRPAFIALMDAAGFAPRPGLLWGLLGHQEFSWTGNGVLD